jgi:NAD+ synthase
MKNEQEQIIKTLKVKPIINVQEEINNRIDFIIDMLKRSYTKALVLGISGGVDSTTCGKMCQMAVDKLEGYQFIAVRLPYGVQRDEEEAQQALDFIKPNQTMTVNIQKAVDELANEVQVLQNLDDKKRDFVIGNIKARQRMIAQYAIAGATNGLVVGTDHAAEALTGFFTKFGDGACDLAPLTGLTKGQVRQIATFLNAPENLVIKTPTADLESLNPGQADEDSLGFSYQNIDDFLTGKEIASDIYEKIVNQYNKTQHKRELPATP